MKIQPVKGTRDFYPPEMAVRNFLEDGFRAASLRNGFEEYDGPIFEYLKMYQVKSGDEIVEQLFSLTDRGGRELAIRPEITPTLARMVNQRINSLARPIKWFSVPRLCRAERPQKGRLREFFQWNIDIIGVDDVLADAEVIFTTIDYLRQVGLTEKDIQAKISSRGLLAAFLEGLGIGEDKLIPLYALLDKKPKLPQDVFEKSLAERVCDSGICKKILEFMDLKTVDGINAIAPDGDRISRAIAEIEKLFSLLEKMGISEYCVFDPSIVRGLAYYTGIVFEVHDIVGELRAICGGGRYDDLLRDFSGPAIAATGMGMGDCVLEILLRQKGLLQEELMTRRVDHFVAFAEPGLFEKAVEITAKIRSAGAAGEFSYKAGALGKQLKQASALGAKKCVIVGTELAEKNSLVVKDMATGTQEEVDVNKFFAELCAGSK